MLQGDLIKALKDSRDTSGKFYSSRSFATSDAPNPMVSIDEFGVLGLPLSVPEAKRLIAASVTQQAPFGMGERKMVDKTVRDTFEVDGSKVCSIICYRLMEKTTMGQKCTIIRFDFAIPDGTSGWTRWWYLISATILE